MTARNQDFVVKNGLQVTSNLVVGSYVGPTQPQIANGAIISGNVGIGTQSVQQGTGLAVFNGNIQAGTDGYGIAFPDGTLQTTAARNTPPGGSNTQVQFNRNDSFAGSNTFVFDNANTYLGIGTAVARSTLDLVGNILISNTVSSTSGIIFPDGSFQTTAVTPTPSFGLEYTIQFAGAANTFSGDSTNLTWNPADSTLYTNNLAITSGAIATNQGTGALQVAGGASITGNLFVGGNLVVIGNVLVTNVEIVDVTLTTMNIVVTGSNASTSSGTGAVILENNGGIGVGGNINVGGSQSLFSNNVGIGTSTALGVSGNILAVYGSQDLYGNIVLHNNESSPTSGIYFPDGSYLVTAAGGGSYSNANVANYLSGPVSIGNLTITNATPSTDSLSGALLLFGGAGIQGNLNISTATTSLFGGNLGVGTSDSLGATGNAFSVYGTANLYGNIQLTNTAAGGSGIYFSDGTFQTTAATSTPSFGPEYTIQFAGAANTFSGDSANLLWDSTNQALVTSNINVLHNIITNDLISNTNITAATVNSTGVAQVASLISNGDISSATLEVSGLAQINSLISNTNITAATLNSTGVAQVASLISNSDITAATVNSTGVAQVASLISNSDISSATLGVSGVAQVGSLFSNSIIQADSQAVLNDIISNNNITTQTLNSIGLAQVSNFISNGDITTSTLEATSLVQVQDLIANASVGIGTVTANYTLDVYGNIHIGNTATTSGIVFPDGSFQDTAYVSAAVTNSYGTPGTVQFAGAGNTFSGSSGNFFWDSGNARLGIGTNLPVAPLTIAQNNNGFGPTASHLQLTNRGTQTVVAWEFSGNVVSTLRVDNTGTWNINSADNNIYFNSDSIGGGNIGVANLWAGTHQFMAVVETAVTLPGNLTVDGGLIALNNYSGNLIDFGVNGVGYPGLGSVGDKIYLYNDGGIGQYSLGVDPTPAMSFSIPTNAYDNY